MLITIFYDHNRFESAVEAAQRGEAYGVEYTDTHMIVTDPDDKMTKLERLTVVEGYLEKEDHRTLYGFLNPDMEKRATI